MPHPDQHDNASPFGQNEVEQIQAELHELREELRQATTELNSLRQIRDRYRIIVENSPDAIIIHVGDEIRFINRAGTRFLGYTSPEEILGMSIFDFVHPDYSNVVQKRIEQIELEHEPTPPIIIKLIHHDTSHLFAEIWSGPVHFSGELASQTVVRDVTWQKQIEAAQKELRHKIETAKIEWESTADSIPDLICLIDNDGRILRANRTLETWQMAKVVDVRGEKIQLLLHPRISSSSEKFNLFWKRAWQKVHAGRTVKFEYYNEHMEKYINIRVRPIQRPLKWSSVEMAVVYIQDVTDNVKAREDLAAERERLAVTLRSIADGVVATDRDGKIMLFNRAAENLTGLTERQVRGKSLREILKVRQEESNEPYEFPVQRVVEANQMLELEEHLILTGNDGSTFIITSTIAPMCDQKGQNIGSVIAFQDVTETRRLERAKASFLNAISHELRTPLTAISGYTELLMGEELDEELKYYVEDIQKSVDKEIDLVEELFTIVQLESGTETYQMSDTNPYSFFTSILDNCHRFVETLVNERYNSSEFELKTHLSDDLKHVFINVDMYRIEKVIEILLSNAVKYSPPERLSISISAECNDNRVKVAVCDKGVGIPRSDLKNIFKPFYQIRKTEFDVSDGIGYGLAKVRRFLDVHGGSIDVESELGQGSCFKFSLPIVK